MLLQIEVGAIISTAQPIFLDSLHMFSNILSRVVSVKAFESAHSKVTKSPCSFMGMKAVPYTIGPAYH